MKRVQHPRHTGRQGFSLAEVAVALLVVSIGILAAFGLFPSGIQAGRASLDETRAVFFADEAFNSFRALATDAEIRWADLGRLHTDAAAVIPVTHGSRLWRDPWDDDNPSDTFLAPRITGNSIRHNKYRIARTPGPNWPPSSPSPPEPHGPFDSALFPWDALRFHSGNPDVDITEYDLRYRMEAVYLASDGSPTNAANSVRMGLRLWIWPGEFGPTNDSDAFYFYTEIINTRGPEGDPLAGPEMP